MTNFTAVTLKPLRANIVKARSSVRRSLELLSDQNSDYAEHHQNLINAYNEMIDTIEYHATEGEAIGRGI